MSSGTSRPVADIVLSVIVVIVAGMIYVESLGLPPAHWEPLGSAALPRALCVFMSFLAAIIFVRAVLTLKGRRAAPVLQDSTPEIRDEDFQKRPWAAAGMFAMFASYIAVMHLGILGFVEATVIFLIAVCLLFTRAAKRHIPWIIVFALVIAIGNYLIFTKFLYIDLPETSWL